MGYTHDFTPGLAGVYLDSPTIMAYVLSSQGRQMGDLSPFQSKPGFPVTKFFSELPRKKVKKVQREYVHGSPTSHAPGLWEELVYGPALAIDGE